MTNLHTLRGCVVVSLSFNVRGPSGGHKTTIYDHIANANVLGVLLCGLLRTLRTLCVPSTNLHTRECTYVYVLSYLLRATTTTSREQSSKAEFAYLNFDTGSDTQNLEQKESSLSSRVLTSQFWYRRFRHTVVITGIMHWIRAYFSWHPMLSILWPLSLVHFGNSTFSLCLLRVFYLFR